MVGKYLFLISYYVIELQILSVFGRYSITKLKRNEEQTSNFILKSEKTTKTLLLLKKYDTQMFE